MMEKIIKKHINSSQARISNDLYQTMYRQSIDDPQTFWAEQANHYLDWDTKWDSVLTGDFNTFDIRWFEGAQLNACYNCLDRHLATRADHMALLWEGDEPSQTRQLTYAQLHKEVCRFANVLKEQGI